MSDINIRLREFRNADDLSKIINQAKASMRGCGEKTIAVKNSKTGEYQNVIITLERTQGFFHRKLQGDLKCKVTFAPIEGRDNGKLSVNSGTYKRYCKSSNLKKFGYASKQKKLDHAKNTKKLGHAFDFKKVQKEIKKNTEERLEEIRTKEGREFFGIGLQELKDERDELQADRKEKTEKLEKEAAKLEKKAKGSKGNKAKELEGKAKALRDAAEQLKPSTREIKLEKEIAKQSTVEGAIEFENQLRE
ncbi:MAG: hypothetical protein LBG09_00720, partial [Puniceicoccales bacterium]|nr:hypothetical protein [Puniceicoccales bacterium]